MTDRSKFEQMLEHLVNEDQEAAKEIFHQIVVEKSREIYETILSEEFEEVEEEKDEEEDEDKEETVDEDFAFGEGDDDTDAIGGDPTDDMLDKISADSEEGEGENELDKEFDDEENDDLEDRVMDLEDAMDELRAQFEKELGGAGDDMDMDMEPTGDDMDKDMKMSMADDVNFMREYIEKVGNPKMGDDGVNNKSIVAGKNDMGGTTANILGGGESTSGGTKGGLANPSTKEDNAGNVNVPGGKAGVKHLKKVSTPAGGDDGDKSAGSTLSGLKSRAK